MVKETFEEIRKWLIEATNEDIEEIGFRIKYKDAGEESYTFKS